MNKYSLILIIVLLTTCTKTRDTNKVKNENIAQAITETSQKITKEWVTVISKGLINQAYSKYNRPNKEKIGLAKLFIDFISLNANGIILLKAKYRTKNQAYKPILNAWFNKKKNGRDYNFNDNIRAGEIKTDKFVENIMFYTSGKTSFYRAKNLSKGDVLVKLEVYYR